MFVKELVYGAQVQVGIAKTISIFSSIILCILVLLQSYSYDILLLSGI